MQARFIAAFTLPTASDRLLGSGKWSMGPRKECGYAGLTSPSSLHDDAATLALSVITSRLAIHAKTPYMAHIETA